MEAGLWRLGSPEPHTQQLVEDLLASKNAHQELETLSARAAEEAKTLCITENLRGGPCVLVDWAAVLEGGRTMLRNFMNTLGDAAAKHIEFLRPAVEKGCVLKKEEINDTLHQDKARCLKLLNNEHYQDLQPALKEFGAR